MYLSLLYFNKGLFCIQKDKWSVLCWVLREDPVFSFIMLQSRSVYRTQPGRLRVLLLCYWTCDEVQQRVHLVLLVNGVLACSSVRCCKSILFRNEWMSLCFVEYTVGWWSGCGELHLFPQVVWSSLSRIVLARFPRCITAVKLISHSGFFSSRKFALLCLLSTAVVMQ